VAEFRARGVEATIRITRNGVLQTEITAIKDFTFETRQRVTTENYLGETASRQDEIFDEVGGSFTVNPEGSQILELQALVVRRSQRRVVNDEQISSTFRIQFPNGVIARIMIPDMKFDPIPLRAPARDQYLELAFTWKSDRYTLSIA